MTDRLSFVGFLKGVVLILCVWCAVVVMCPFQSVQALFIEESESCTSECRMWLAEVDAAVAPALRSLEASVSHYLDSSAGGLGEEKFLSLTGGVLNAFDLGNAFDVVHALLLLAAQRLAVMGDLLTVLAVVAAAHFVDAVSQRKIASISFHAFRPVVGSFALWSLRVLPFVALTVIFIPFTAMGLIAAVAMALALGALGVWARHFHRFER